MEDNLKKLVEKIEQIIPYVIATISRNNSEIVQDFPKCWWGIHGGRAHQSKIFLEGLLKLAQEIRYEVIDEWERQEKILHGTKEVLLEAHKIIKAMDKWNTDVEKMLGKAPNTGFERAGDILAQIDKVLKSIVKETEDKNEKQS